MLLLIRTVLPLRQTYTHRAMHDFNSVQVDSLADTEMMANKYLQSLYLYDYHHLCSRLLISSHKMNTDFT